MNNPKLIKTVRWLTMLGIPLWVGLGLFAAFITPAYPRYEYAKDNFPPDRYGWTQEQRLDLALVAVEYLDRPERAEDVIYMLEEQRKPDSDKPLYNESEIGHMLDVKIVADGVVRRFAGIGGILTVLGLAFLLWRADTRLFAYQAIQQGGMILTLLLLGIGLFIGLGWDMFFTLFHELLFPPDSWMFPLDDSLIRLFPNKFWFDFGVLASGTIFVAGALIWGFGTYLYRTNPFSTSQRRRALKKGAR